MSELLKLAGYVGVPRKGEKVCPVCKGNGQHNRRIPFGLFMGGYFDPCDRCSATGVVRARQGDVK